MPHIVSLLPAAPATPATTPAPVTSAVAPGALLPPDLTSPNFLAQFKAALKTIAKVVVQPQLTQRPATDPNAAPLMSPVSDEPSQPDVPTAADADKHADVRMPDLLAELGFAVVPPAFLIPVAPPSMAMAATGASAANERQAQAPQSIAQPQLTPRVTQSPANPGLVMMRPGPVQAQAQATPDAQVGQAPSQTLPAAPRGQTLPAPQPGRPLTDLQLGQMPPAGPLVQTLPAPRAGQTLPDAQLGQALADLQLGQPLPDAALGQALPQTAPVTHQPIAHLKPADQPQSPISTLTVQPSLATAPDVSATVLPPSTPAAHLPASGAPASTSAPQIGFTPQASPGGSQSGDARGGHSRNAPDRIASISAEGATAAFVPAAETAAAMAVPVSAVPLPVQIGPSQVVAQIARHADVIRLPGNRGLHIQLHPDDLGGVQVTVRYAPGGGVELHINAEHAATGALVQAGWTELRDALASHGISPDRLIMSVTAPPSAGQADLSGSGNRSADPNFNPDSQSQGQSRQDNPQQRASQTRSGGLEPVASTDDNPRVASATGTPSRIDYRV